MTYKNWRYTLDNQRIAWLDFDKADGNTNTLSSEVLNELDAIIAALRIEKPLGVVIRSAKTSGFAAGADVKEFSALKSFDTAVKFIELGQTTFDHLEQLDCPTVALIQGFCLGGGLELALACKYRIADDDARTKLGVPEVRLGIHPGFGGTVRLPPLLGAPAAMDLMLTGRSLSARAAQKIGLVDYAVPARHLEMAARETILKPPPRKRAQGWKALTNHALARPLLARTLRKQVAQKARADHYPAPYAIIDLWEKFAGDPRRMLREERFSEARLVTNESARNLIRVFFLQERMKALGQKNLINPKHVHVIGGGVMGGDIAAWCAQQGMRVTLQDRKPEHIARVIKRAADLYKKTLKVPRLVQAALDRLVPDIDGNGVARADVIIEAIFENIEAKQALFREIEPKMRADALLATNTSSIPLSVLSKALQRPERLIGLHFFNPVSKMQLIEIVSDTNTDPQVAARAAAFARHIDRLPLPVASKPGFLVNRILMPYLMEAVLLESEGVPAPAIDQAALNFGMPMGPLELADTVGLDICLHVGEILGQHFGQEVPARLKKLVEAGKLGRKSGAGFYQWQGDKKGEPEKGGHNSPGEPEIIDRLMLRLLNEAMACLREGVVSDADLLDAGVIFGTGFAPFHGGPMNYIKSRGQSTLNTRLVDLKSRFGARFLPDPHWNKVG